MIVHSSILIVSTIKLFKSVCCKIWNFYQKIPQKVWARVAILKTHFSIPKILPWWLKWQRIRLQCGRPGFDPWVGKIPWRRAWNPLQYSCLENPHEERSLAGYRPRGHKESDLTKQLSKAQNLTWNGDSTQNGSILKYLLMNQSY